MNSKCVPLMCQLVFLICLRAFFSAITATFVHSDSKHFTTLLFCYFFPVSTVQHSHVRGHLLFCRWRRQSLKSCKAARSVRENLVRVGHPTKEHRSGSSTGSNKSIKIPGVGINEYKRCNPLQEIHRYSPLQEYIEYNYIKPWMHPITLVIYVTCT